MRSADLPIGRRLRTAKAVIPVIKTIHTAETLALALARQQRFFDRHVASRRVGRAAATPPALDQSS